MKASFKGYFEPTPKLMRKIGDSAMIIGASFTAWAGVTDKAHWLIIGGAIFTLLGKLVTNFFKE